MTGERKIRILIVDDHEIVRMGLISLFGTKHDLEVVGEAEDGASAIESAVRLKPDVILMDLMMPGMDGTMATARIRKVLPSAKVIVLTTFGTSDGIAHSLEAGASGAFLKNTNNVQLVNGIRAVAAGQRIVAAEVEQMLKEFPPVPKLTNRQQEILQSVTLGLTNKDIASQFEIREYSVKMHLIEIFRKLGVANRAEAVAIALRKHLLKI